SASRRVSRRATLREGHRRCPSLCLLWQECSRRSRGPEVEEAMVQQSVRMTADELLRLPDDEHRYELVRGELRRMAPAGGGPGLDAMLIGARRFSYVESHRLGYVFAAETGFYLERDPDTVRAPDVSFVRQDRISRPLTSGYLPLSPDLAVEVVSPSESAEE